MDGCCCLSDGKMLATAAGQLKTFNCSDHKKMQKFSGHPVSVIQFSDFFFFWCACHIFHFMMWLNPAILIGLIFSNYNL